AADRFPNSAVHVSAVGTAVSAASIRHLPLPSDRGDGRLFLVWLVDHGGIAASILGRQSGKLESAELEYLGRGLDLSGVRFRMPNPGSSVLLRSGGADRGRASGASGGQRQIFGRLLRGRLAAQPLWFLDG